jgi:hypothetical protein
VNRVEDLISK